MSLKNTFNGTPSQEEMDDFVDAARDGLDDAVAEFLDKYPAAVDEMDAEGWTALIRASHYGRMDTVKLLLKRGADVNGKDANGWAPLMVTAAGKHMELAKLLLKEGAAIDATDNEGQTALMWAAWNGYGEMATFLMERGAAIDKKDNKGRTALMCAQQRSETGAEKILALAEDIADFSPALKRTIPAPRPLKAAKP